MTVDQIFFSHFQIIMITRLRLANIPALSCRQVNMYMFSQISVYDIPGINDNDAAVTIRFHGIFNYLDLLPYNYQAGLLSIT